MGFPASFFLFLQYQSGNLRPRIVANQRSLRGEKHGRPNHHFLLRHPKGCPHSRRSREALTLLDLSTFNTTNVTNMSDMFLGCTALTTIYCNDDWNHGLFHQERQHRHLAGKHHRRHRRPRHLHHGRQADEADTDRAEHPAHERRNNTENRQKTMTDRPAHRRAQRPERLPPELT